MTKPDRPSVIYKILLPADWAQLCDETTSLGSTLDQTDGYIHFSTAEQLQATLDLHYKNAGQVIIAEVPLEKLEQRDVRWEPARDGSLFPHLYDALRTTMIKRHWILHPSQDGRYELPDLSHKS